MAHYARVNSENIVTFVTPIPNEMITDENGVEHDERAFGHLYITIPDSINDRWVRTSYSENFRKKYAGTGDTWHSELDAFISPQPYPSWTLNTETCNWEPPVPKPTDSNDYWWDESNTSWVEIT